MFFAVISWIIWEWVLLCDRIQSNTSKLKEFLTFCNMTSDYTFNTYNTIIMAKSISCMK